MRVLLAGLGEPVAGTRLNLNEVLARVVDQFAILRDLHQQNPAEILEYPADKTIIDLFKAAKPHVPKSDPVREVLESLIFEHENKRLKLKVSQLLPMIMSLQGALQDKANRRDASNARRGRSSPSSTGNKSRPRHLNLPPTPSPPQYRPTILADYRNELTDLRSGYSPH